MKNTYTGNETENINIKNNSLSTMLTAKIIKKGDITQHHIDI